MSASRQHGQNGSVGVRTRTAELLERIEGNAVEKPSSGLGEAIRLRGFQQPPSNPAAWYAYKHKTRPGVPAIELLLREDHSLKPFEVVLGWRSGQRLQSGLCSSWASSRLRCGGSPVARGCGSCISGQVQQQARFHRRHL